MTHKYNVSLLCIVYFGYYFVIIMHHLTWVIIIMYETYT